MTPDFALSLSFSGISLLQRAASAGGPKSGWYELGAVALDVEDLAGALSVLREEAVPHPDIDGPEVLLLLPQEQVRYLALPLSGDDPMAQAEAALIEATPYTAEEIVFDWRAVEGQLQVAAVARETLAEAESFAIEHRFLPVGFAASPEDVEFDGMPFFGATASAMTHLAPGVSVEGEVEPIERIEGQPPGKPDTISIAAVSDTIDLPPADPVAVDATTQTPDAATSSAEQLPDDAGQSDADPAHPVQSDAPPKQAVKRPVDDIVAELVVPAADLAGTSDAQNAEPPAPEHDHPRPDHLDTGIAGDDEAQAKSAPAPSVLSPRIPDPDDIPPLNKSLRAAQPDAGAMPFSSLRAERPSLPNAGDTSAPHPPAPPGAPAPNPTTEGMTQPITAAGQTPTTEEALANAVKARAAASFDAPTPEAASTKVRSNPVTNVLARAQSGLGRGAGFVSRRKTARQNENDLTLQAPAAGTTATAPPEANVQGKAKAALTASNKMDEAERMTMFGARRNVRKPAVGGKPKFLGLMLTAALLIFLLGMAAWAAVFVDEGLARFFRSPQSTPDSVQTANVATGDVDQTTPQSAAPTEQTDASLPALTLPGTQSGAGTEAGSDTSIVDPITDALRTAGLTPGISAELPAALPDPDLQGLARPLNAEALSPEEAEARYAVTGIWQRAPVPPAELGQSVLDDLYLTSVDNAVTQHDAVALPNVTSFGNDATFVDPGLPPRADQRYDFDARGLIRPSTSGVVTPDGYTLVLGRPDVLPPPRPRRSTPDGVLDNRQDTGQNANRPSTDAAQDGTPGDTPAQTTPGVIGSGVTEPAMIAPLVIDPSLRGFKPKRRPQDLSEKNERAQLGGLTRAELALRRPKARPDRVSRRAAQQIAGAVQSAVDQAAVAAAVEAARSTQPPETPAANGQETAQPVAGIPLPKKRPRNIASLVKRAEREDSQRVAAIAPRTVKPAAPTRSNVAREATQRRAINLRRVNLIGVYGTPSQRRALVRLANGRFKKVKIGDRVDGGRVVAISDSQLRYQKSGRNVTLKLPKG